MWIVWQFILQYDKKGWSVLINSHILIEFSTFCFIYFPTIGICYSLWIFARCFFTLISYYATIIEQEMIWRSLEYWQRLQWSTPVCNINEAQLDKSVLVRWQRDNSVTLSFQINEVAFIIFKD